VTKDQIAEQFADSLEKAQLAMVNEILALKDSMLRDEFMSLMSSIDVRDYVLNQIGLQKDIDILMSQYESVLLGMEFTGAVTEETLLSLVKLDRATFISQINTMGEKVVDEAIKGVVGNKTTAQITESILSGSGGVLRKDQAKTLANTALNTFERTVTSEMARFDTEDATYVYQGIIDDKTRDICLEMMSAGALTRSEIDSRYAGAFIDGGGFNCRHRWARETSVSRKLTDPKDAVKQIEKKGGFKKTPLTPQQQLEQNG